MNNNNLLGRRESIQTGRAEFLWSVPFTDPVTYGLRTKGGAIFEQGLVVGDNDTVIPGALRFRDGGLQTRVFDKWMKLAGVDITPGVEDAIVTFDEKGDLQASDAILSGSDLTGLSLLETEAIVSPLGSPLQIGNALLSFPDIDGATGEVMTTDGMGQLEFRQAPLFTSNAIENRMVATISDSSRPWEIDPLLFSPTAAKNGITGLAQIDTESVHTNKLDEQIPGNGIAIHSNVSLLNDHTLKVAHTESVNPETFTQAVTTPVIRFVLSGPPTNNGSVAQLITPTVSGRLRSITISVRAVSDSPNIILPVSFQVAIYTGSSGTSGPLLGKSGIQILLPPSPGSVVGNLTYESFGAEITLSSGSTYSIVAIGYGTTEYHEPTDFFSYGELNTVTIADASPPWPMADTIIEFDSGSWITRSNAAGLFEYEIQEDSKEKAIVFISPSVPASSADSVGVTGSVTWDDDYLYLKTGVGWKRITMASF